MAIIMPDDYVCV